MVKKCLRPIKLLFLYIRFCIVQIKYGKPVVKNSIETINKIVDSDLSVYRFGDGEFNIINGKSIKFQEYDQKLATRMREILQNHDNKVMVCIPEIYSHRTIKTLKYKSRVFWFLYAIQNFKWISKYLNKNSVYFDSCVTRPYIRYNKKYIAKSDEIFSKLKLIWDKKDIIIVEGQYSRLGVNNDLFKNAKSIKRILCPSRNAYTKYDEILSSVENNSKGKLVIISLGPTATVLAKDLAEKGIRAIDLGHIDLEYEWYTRKVDERIVVEGKIVNELDNEEVSDINNLEYRQSIIDEII